MTTYFWLDWAILAVSLFNTIILTWLGITVLLNASRPGWGVWLMGGGLLAGAVFFISHTAILGQEIALNPDGLNFWWQVGWIPVTVAPFAWYVVMLWYGGFWNQPRPPLYRRHLPWFILMTTLSLSFVVLIATANSIPAYEQVIQLDLSGAMTLNGVPLLFLVFPVFMMACILLSIDALHHSAMSESATRHQAQRRSRPWLVSTAISLLMVSILVAVFIAAIIRQARAQAFWKIDLTTLGLFDLVMQLLIAAATIFVGQAVVSYEVFTGKVLPRRGFSRHWRSILMIAAGYGILVGWSLAIQLRPVYSLLLTSLLMVIFYALYTWRSFLEREQFMERLRPFVSSQNLVSHLMSVNSDVDTHAETLFRAVCQDVLGTERARLIPMGALKPLIETGLAFPDATAAPDVSPPSNLDAAILNLDPLPPAAYQWAIPLWGERGLIGALMIGSKRGGGLYTQEEMEITQAAGERIVDMLAGEKMARSLMSLQRKRVSESRMLDMQVRRKLHDEVLPMIHTAVLELSASPANSATVQSLSQVHGAIAELIRTPQRRTLDTDATFDLVGGIHSIIETEFRYAFESVNWFGVNQLLIEPLAGEVALGAVREAIRNSAIHARGTEANHPLNLEIHAVRDEFITISIQDDGVGILNSDRNLSIKPVLASGSGLALHATLLALVGGSLVIKPNEKVGMVTIIQLPLDVLSNL